MSESNQEGYQTLGWIINESEKGIYLVVADEDIQQEIMDIYRRGEVKIYDYKRHPEAYSFQKLKSWIEPFEDIQTIFITNFQFAIENDDDLKRLNFSRDMLIGLNKNLIFFTTPFGDDQLATNAYDFYSFIRIRIQFHNYETEVHIQNKDVASEQIGVPYEADEDLTKRRQKLQETYSMFEMAKDLFSNGEYEKSVNLLLQIKDIRKAILGTEHLETANIYYELANAYETQGKYEQAIEVCMKSMEIRKKY